MDTHRRDWLKRLGTGSAVAVPSVLLGDVESVYEQTMRSILGNATVKPDSRIELHLPTDAVNGAVVPLGVDSAVPGTLKIVVLVDNHPLAKVAELDTSSTLLKPRLSTHLQLQHAATITAFVATKTGWHSNAKKISSLGQSC